MNKTRWIGVLAGLALILAAFALAVWQSAPLLTSAGTALAQAAPTQTPAPQPTTVPSAQGQNPANDLVQTFWNALAARLGLNVDDLKTKVTESAKDAIEQAVKDGKLTRAQADRLEQRLNSQHPFGPMFFGAFAKGVRNGFQKGFGRGFEFGRLDQLEAVATALNLKPADLQSQLEAGKTLADIAKAQGVDEAKVKQAIIDTTKAQLQREVQDGVLTQDRANQILANLTPDKIDLTKLPGRFGWGRH